MLVLPHNTGLHYFEGHTSCVKHIHLLEELIFVLHGGSTVITDKFTRKLSGSFFIYSPRRTIHEQINDPDEKYSRWMLIFDKTVQLHGISFPDEPFVLELTDEQSEHFSLMLTNLSELFECCENASGSEKGGYAKMRRDLMISMLANDLCELINSSPTDAEHDSDSGISAICDYIDANFEKQLSLDELAARFFISRTKLTRSFRKKTGMSVGEYITAIRVSRSKQLLLEPRQLEEIARLCGFQSANYYIKVFEKVCRMTPTYFRNRYTPDYIKGSGYVCEKSSARQPSEQSEQNKNAE